MKVIAGFSRYSISKEGEVTENATGRTLPVFTCSRGYLSVTGLLSDEGTRFKKSVHRLVAEAYLPNPDNLPEVNHKDECPSNPHVSNLEWCSRQYNAEYSIAKHFKLISPSGELTRIFNMAKFCRENGLSRANLHKVAKGIRKSHKGWTKYETK